MTNSNRQDARRRLRTYYNECGSSFDPDLQDVVEWEHGLDGDSDVRYFGVFLKNLYHQILGRHL